MPSPTIEICVDSTEGVLAARAGGADRVELCAGLIEGGTTPSYGCVQAALALPSIEVAVMVRPRAGDFLYSPAEVDTMERDLVALRSLGCRAVVFGALDEDGQLDLQVMQRLRSAAQPMDVVCHRAFDLCRDRAQTLEQLVGLGVRRVLTSGGAPTALEGADQLRELVARAAERIEVMAGGGIRPHNADEIVRRTGAHALHASAFEERASAMRYRNMDCAMGAVEVPGEYVRRTTSEQRVRALVEAPRSAQGSS